MAEDDYVALMASLPALGPMLAAKRPPISRLRLEARLNGLSADHRRELDAVFELIDWPRAARAGTDAALILRARRLRPTIADPTLGRLLDHRLELRTVIAALRRRAAGEDAPPPGEAWGWGRYVKRIRAAWREPGLGVERAFPWVLAAREALETQNAAGMERIALEAAWRQAERLSVGHAFDFAAVALYAARWTLLDRWTRYDAEAAAARFSDLIDAALEALPDPLPDAPPAALPDAPPADPPASPPGPTMETFQ